MSLFSIKRSTYNNAMETNPDETYNPANDDNQGVVQLMAQAEQASQAKGVDQNPHTGSTTAVTQNKQRHQFELNTDGKVSIVAYQFVNDETLALTHTEVHPDLEGKGVGSALVKGVLELVEQNNQRIVPLCPFVAAYIKRHPEWQRVVSTDYSEDDF